MDFKSMHQALDDMERRMKAADRAEDTTFIGARKLYKTDGPMPGDSADSAAEDPERIPAESSEATLVGSGVYDFDGVSFHMPVIDLDLPCTLVPSSTPGHYHLYLNRAMEFSTMIEMLEAMARAGVVQWGFVEWAKKRGQAFVRYPGVKKGVDKRPVPAGTRPERITLGWY